MPMQYYGPSIKDVDIKLSQQEALLEYSSLATIEVGKYSLTFYDFLFLEKGTLEYRNRA
jgi:hypothetical protein